MKKYIAKMIGTMVLVLMGCGSAVFAGSMAVTVDAGVETIGVVLAFDLSVVAMAYAIGGVSGCHINPAITLGVFLSRRMSGKDAGIYGVSNNRSHHRFCSPLRTGIYRNIGESGTQYRSGTVTGRRKHCHNCSCLSSRRLWEPS